MRAAAPLLPPREGPSFRPGAAVVQSQAGIIFSGVDQRCRENSDSEADLAVARRGWGGAGQRCPPQRALGVGGTKQGLGTMALVGVTVLSASSVWGQGCGGHPELIRSRRGQLAPPPPTPCPRSLARLSPPQRLPEKQPCCLDAGQALQTAHPHPSPGRLARRLCKPAVVLPPQPRHSAVLGGLLLPSGAQPKRPAPLLLPLPSPRAECEGLCPGTLGELVELGQDQALV